MPFRHVENCSRKRCILMPVGTVPRSNGVMLRGEVNAVDVLLFVSAQLQRRCRWLSKLIHQDVLPCRYGNDATSTRGTEKKGNALQGLYGFGTLLGRRAVCLARRVMGRLSDRRTAEGHRQ